MTDKKIIDGVDVSGCCALDEDFKFSLLQDQFQTLKAENEELKEKLANKGYITIDEATFDKHVKNFGILMNYKLAIEEIKKTATNLRTRKDYHSPDEVNADIDKILTITNEVLKNE